MRNKGIWKILAISVVLAIVACSVAVFSAVNLGEGIGEKGIDEGGGEGVISLVSPSFIGVAGAAEVAGGNAFPEDEAGIAAYVNVRQIIADAGESMDFQKAKSAFFSIEDENDTYIIGQVALYGFNKELVAPHVYVTEDGWIVAYFLKSEEPSKVTPWFKYSEPITETTLDEAIHKVWDCLTSDFSVVIDFNKVKSNIKYYDFEFPEANRIMLIVDKASDSHYPCSVADSFNLTIPTACELYEASWSVYTSRHGSSGDVRISNELEYIIHKISGVERAYGKFTEKQLSNDGTTPTVKFSAQAGGEFEVGVAVALVYRAG
jgi:hypothetical protein